MAFQSNTFALLGDKELIAKLSALEKTVGAKIMTRSVAPGARIVARAAKALAPGSLKQTIRVRVKKNKIGQVYGRIYSSRKYVNKDGEKPGYYAHLIEKGHVIRRVKDGPVVGKAGPHPFMRPAIDTNRQAALSAVRDRARSELEKEARAL